MQRFHILCVPDRTATCVAVALHSKRDHAKNKIAGRIIPFLPGFWDKNTVICVGAMPYRRVFPATTRT